MQLPHQYRSIKAMSSQSSTQLPRLPSDHLLHVILLSTIASISSQARISLQQIRTFLINQLELPTHFSEALVDPRLDITDLYGTFAQLAQAICEEDLRVKTGYKDKLQPWYRKVELLEALEGSGLWELVERVASYKGDFVPLEYLQQERITDKAATIVMKDTMRVIRLPERFSRVTFGQAEVPNVSVDSAQGLLTVRKEHDAVVLKQGVTKAPDARLQLVPGKVYVLRPSQFFSLANVATLFILRISPSSLCLQYELSPGRLELITFDSSLKLRFTIGRSPACDLCLPQAAVSKLHAVVQRAEKDWVVLAEETVNGCYRYLYAGEGRESEELVVRSKMEVVVGDNTVMRIDVEANPA